MARLGTQVCSLLTDIAISNLRSRKIFTFVDFLQEDPEKLVNICHLSYTEIMIIRRNLISHYSAFPKDGLEAYTELLMYSAIIPSGLASVDVMLDGGFLTGSLTELYGLPSSGKTQLCFTIIANAALNLKQQVHYIDTKGGFSGKRMQSLFESRCSNSEVVRQALKNIIVTSVKTLNELLSFLHHLKVNLNQDAIDGKTTRLIIIDSLPGLFYQFIGEESSDGIGLMNNLATILKFIAVENRIAFIIINLASKGLDEDVPNVDHGLNVPFGSEPQLLSLKPALGNYWLHVPNLRLFLHKTNCENEIKVIIAKCGNLRIGKSCTVYIRDVGLTHM